MGISLCDVIEKGLVSNKLILALPNEGSCECGAELMFTDSLNQIYCPNSRCHTKVASRLEAMAKEMKADGWGLSTCLAVVKQLGMISPFQVFDIKDKGLQGKLEGISSLDKKLNEICDVGKRRVKLARMVQLCGIPNVDTIAFKIFDGYRSIADAYADIESGQVPFIADKLGIKNSETGVLAWQVYNNLIEYKAELLYGEQKFEIYNPIGDVLRIAITHGVNGFTNKAEFIQYINIRYAGKINATLLKTVTGDCDVLINDAGTGSTKLSTATKINAKSIETTGREKIKICSSKQFLEMIENKYGGTLADEEDEELGEDSTE